MTFDIRVRDEEVITALDQMDRKIATSAVKAAVKKAGLFLKPKVKAEAPKGKTGNLRAKVGTRVKKSRQPQGTYYAVTTSFARHRHLVIRGTKERFTKGSHAYRGVMPPNDFVSRVADANEDEAVRIAMAELARQLDLT